MKDVHFIDDLEQVRVLADPLRMRLLEAFAEQRATTKQVAKMIGESPTKLYHHVDALERAGLITLVETRPNRGTTEKYYEPLARQFKLTRDMFSLVAREMSTDLRDIFAYALEETAADIRASSEAGLLEPEGDHEHATFSRFQITGTREEIDAVLKKLRKFIAETQPIQNKGGGVRYGITVAAYPLAKKEGVKK